MTWKKQYQKHIWSVQDRLAETANREMDIALLGILEQCTNEWLEKGVYTKPNEMLMYLVVERYYRRVVEQAYHASQIAKNVQKPHIVKKNLAAGRTYGIPRRLPSLVKFFADKGTWPVMRKRARRIVKALRRTYFQKLDKKFAEIGPQLQNGEKTVEEVKKELRQAWKATKPRVETIFRTETTNYFNKIQVSFFDGDEDIIGFLFQANRDSATTSICQARHGLVYRPGTKLLKENTPACHYNCRSELIPLANIPQNLTMLKDPSRDPSKRKVPPLPPGWVSGRKK